MPKTTTALYRATPLVSPSISLPRPTSPFLHLPFRLPNLFLTSSTSSIYLTTTHPLLFLNIKPTVSSILTCTLHSTHPNSHLIASASSIFLSPTSPTSCAPSRTLRTASSSMRSVLRPPRDPLYLIPSAAPRPPLAKIWRTSSSLSPSLWTPSTLWRRPNSSSPSQSTLSTCWRTYLKRSAPMRARFSPRTPLPRRLPLLPFTIVWSLTTAFTSLPSLPKWSPWS